MDETKTGNCAGRPRVGDVVRLKGNHEIMTVVDSPNAIDLECAWTENGSLRREVFNALALELA